MKKAVDSQMNISPEANPVTGPKTNYVSTAIIIAIMLAPQLAMAAGNPIQSFLDGIIGFLNSGVMRSVAILAVMSMGVAAYLGKISWELVMKIGGGIILTFGAAALVDQFSPMAA